MAEQEVSAENELTSSEGSQADLEILGPEDETLLSQLESNPRIMRVMQSRFHSGPLPSSEDMAEYNQIIPNGADRIMRMAEKEQSARIDLMANNSQRYFDAKKRGQLIGLAIVMVFVLLALFLFYKEQYMLGVVLLGADLMAIVTVFVVEKRSKGSDEE